MEVKKKKSKTKYIVLAIFLLILVVTYAFDYIRCTTYTLEVTASETEPYASSSERVKIRIRISRFGKVQSGHKVFAMQSAGSLDTYIGYTDDDGLVDFVYTPYDSSEFVPAGEVTITIRDESNSVFWEVNAVTTLVLNLREPLQE